MADFKYVPIEERDNLSLEEIENYRTRVWGLFAPVIRNDMSEAVERRGAVLESLENLCFDCGLCARGELTVDGLVGKIRATLNVEKEIGRLLQNKRIYSVQYLEYHRVLRSYLGGKICDSEDRSKTKTLQREMVGFEYVPFDERAPWSKDEKENYRSRIWGLFYVSMRQETLSSQEKWKKAVTGLRSIPEQCLRGEITIGTCDEKLTERLNLFNEAKGHVENYRALFSQFLEQNQQLDAMFGKRIVIPDKEA